MSSAYQIMLDTVPHNALQVAPSTIRGAGLGLFAGRDYKKGEIVTFYDGQLIQHVEAQKRERLGLDTHIRSHIQLRWDIDGLRVDPKDPLVGKASFINHDKKRANVKFGFADSPVNDAIFEKYKRGLSVQFDPTERKTFVYTLRAVKSGEEFFVDYGNDYGLNEEDEDDSFIERD
jgi:SET domain-containing protein